MDHLRQYSANNIQQREFTTFVDKTKQKKLYLLRFVPFQSNISEYFQFLLLANKITFKYANSG